MLGQEASLTVLGNCSYSFVKAYSLMINVSVEAQVNIISMVLTLIVAKSKGLPLHIIICSEANVNMSLQTNPVS